MDSCRWPSADSGVGIHRLEHIEYLVSCPQSCLCLLAGRAAFCPLSDYFRVLRFLNARNVSSKVRTQYCLERGTDFRRSLPFGACWGKLGFSARPEHPAALRDVVGATRGIIVTGGSNAQCLLDGRVEESGVEPRRLPLLGVLATDAAVNR